MSDVGFTSQKGELHKSSIGRRSQSRTADRHRDTFPSLISWFTWNKHWRDYES